MAGKNVRVGFAVALALVILPTSLLATTVLRLGTQDLLEKSPTVILGEVLEQETRLFEDGDFPITLTTVAVEESFKGAPRPVIEIFTLGGRVDDLIGEVSGENQFQPGERVFLFLTPKEGWENTYTVYGMFQGKWNVMDDASGVTYLQNDHAEQILQQPASELVPLDDQGRMNFENFIQTVRQELDLN
ncbi:MAG: hypothetical protein GF355_16295 [Candidatus Eisenbacteria bacterium]|nr:hypothetical protein [Candidatus Eisenbacteria bacterium]